MKSKHFKRAATTALGLTLVACAPSGSQKTLEQELGYLRGNNNGITEDLRGLNNRPELFIKVGDQVLRIVTTEKEAVLPFSDQKLEKAFTIVKDISGAGLRFNIPISTIDTGAKETVAATTSQKPTNQHVLLYEKSPSDTPAISSLADVTLRRAFTLWAKGQNLPTLSVIVDDDRSSKPMVGSNVSAAFNAGITEMFQSTLDVKTNSDVFALNAQEDVANSLGRLVSFSLSGEPYTSYTNSVTNVPLEIAARQGYNMPYILFNEPTYDALQHGTFTPSMLTSYTFGHP